MKLLLLALLTSLVWPTIAAAQAYPDLTFQMLSALRREGVEVRDPNCAKRPCDMGAIPEDMSVDQFMKVDQLSLRGLQFNAFPHFVFKMKELKYLDITDVGIAVDVYQKLSELQKLEVLVDRYRSTSHVFALDGLPNLKALTLEANIYNQAGVTNALRASPQIAQRLVSLDLLGDAGAENGICSVATYFVPYPNLTRLRIAIDLAAEYRDVFSLPSLQAFEAPKCPTNTIILDRLN